MRFAMLCVPMRTHHKDAHTPLAVISLLPHSEKLGKNMFGRESFK